MPHRRQNSMVRMFTSFIFGVTIVPSPCSTRMQGTPRQPSSPARASPTGPPPTIRTDVFFTGKFPSIDPHACGLSNVQPFPMLDCDVGGKLLRRVGLRLRADIGDQLLNLRRLHALV